VATPRPPDCMTETGPSSGSMGLLNSAAPADRPRSAAIADASRNARASYDASTAALRMRAGFG
jgi:hypothetical protein